MLYKLLSVENYTPSNIGDYVQALAASQYLPQIDGFINREKLSNYDGEDCKVIMNGWYMHNPQNWPPSSKIHPLFVSFHLNISAEKQMLSENGIKYLKQYEPIGCRDEFTHEVLQRNGVESYFSGCLTLTLGNCYKSFERDSEVYFVDPYIPKENNIRLLVKDTIYFVLHPWQTISISSRMKVGSSRIKNWLRVARFGRLYSKVFTNDVLFRANYISQENNFYSSLTNSEKLQEAEKLIKLYAKASFVVTSRIHCALPSIGLETPVYFIQKSSDKIDSTCRFGGLISLFNTITVGNDSISCSFLNKEKLSMQRIVPNKDSWKELAKSLTERCTRFIEK